MCVRERVRVRRENADWGLGRGEERKRGQDGRRVSNLSTVVFWMDQRKKKREEEKGKKCLLNIFNIY